MFKPFFVHINPYQAGHAYGRKRGCTVLVKPNDEHTVYVQHTFCSKKDQYCKKTGREEAAKATEVVVNKRRIPAYIGELEAKVIYGLVLEGDGARRAHNHMHLLKNFI